MRREPAKATPAAPFRECSRFTTAAFDLSPVEAPNISRWVDWETSAVYSMLKAGGLLMAKSSAGTIVVAAISAMTTVPSTSLAPERPKKEGREAGLPRALCFRTVAVVRARGRFTSSHRQHPALSAIAG